MKLRSLILLLPLIMTAGCVSTPTEDTGKKPPREESVKAPSTPQPKTVRIKIPDAPPNPATGEAPTIQKNMFNVLAIGNKLYANDAPVKNVEALKGLLAQHNKPVVSLSVHRCVDSTQAKTLMEAIQPLTDTPIAYTAFGSYTDESCNL